MSRYRGRLIRWNDERGFGFIESDVEKNGIFLHISELTKMSRRPVVNDIILYELSIENKKIKAINATIEDVETIRTLPKTYMRKEVGRSQWYKSKPLLLVIFVLVILFLAYRSFPNYRKFNSQNSIDYKAVSAAPAISPDTTSHRETNNKFTCDGRTRCSQMKSQEEAIFFLKNCPNTQMDGDNDGAPCEDKFGKN